jgi:hypothetical protein
VSYRSVEEAEVAFSKFSVNVRIQDQWWIDASEGRRVWIIFSSAHCLLHRELWVFTGAEAVSYQDGANGLKPASITRTNAREQGRIESKSPSMEVPKASE